MSTHRRRISDELIRAIESGELPPGSPLPSTRVFAQQLGVSRDTVVKSFAELESMFYIRSSSTRGYFVCDRADIRKSPTKPIEMMPVGSKHLSGYGQRLLLNQDRFMFTPDFSALNYGAPPMDLLPTERWQQHLRNFAKSASPPSRPPVLGLSRLRESMAGFLNRSKALSCQRQEVILFSGTLTAMNLLCRLLLNPGETIAVEEPGFGGIRNVAKEHGATLLKVPVDGDGMTIDLLNADPEVKLVYVTAGHHDPTGIQLSDQRKQELLDWAKRNNTWIIEDDFDGHFQYTKTNPRCLKAMDQNDSVIYLSTFWKVLYPLTNLGYCVLPKSLVGLVEKVKINADGFPDLLQQQTLAALIDDGYLERFIRRLQKIYQNRRYSLIYSLKKIFGDYVAIQKSFSGTYCLVTFTDWNDEAVLHAAKIAELPLISIAGYYFENPPLREFIIDFSCLEEKTVDTKVTRFYEVLSGS